MKNVEVKILRGGKWQVEENLVLKKGKVYVLKHKKLKIEIIWLYHDVPVAGYEEIWKTTELGNKKLLVAKYNKRCRKICE